MNFNNLFKINPFDSNNHNQDKLCISELISLTKYHYNYCKEYKKVIDSYKINLNKIINLKDIPYLPVNLFKYYNLISINKAKDLKIISSSGTGSNLKSKTPFLGLETMIRMLHLLKPNSYCGIGTHPITMLPLVKKYLNRYTGKLTHFYLINKRVKKFKIANLSKIDFSIEDYKITSLNHIYYKEIKSFNFLEKNFNFKKFQNLPFKSKWYINKRYFEHPIYKYKFFFIKNYKTNLCSLLVTRKINYKNSKIIRFVDYVGNINDFVVIREIANNLLIKENIEYVDFYAARLPRNIKNKINFRTVRENDINIIPDYFEPFVKKNVKIYFEASNNKMVLFKADADQDRPRLQR